MAERIAFQPRPVDTKALLRERLESAPDEHAEALLATLELLQTAHDRGLIDTARGVLSAQDEITGTVARMARQPEGVAALRNLLTLVKLAGQLPPEMLEQLTTGLRDGLAEHTAEAHPPGMLTLLRRALSPQGRRGLSLLTHLLTASGKAVVK
ncbi:MAG: DUF1641 domain-containing protein [Acidobacteriota bacterium]|nr:DUF1641 domain-containing protein [Acidobacteriota bacterium]